MWSRDVLANALAEIVNAQGLKHARLLDKMKMNARGELMVAIIVPASRPGEWTNR